jgi:hypothetical protein
MDNPALYLIACALFYNGVALSNGNWFILIFCSFFGGYSALSHFLEK